MRVIIFDCGSLPCEDIPALPCSRHIETVRVTSHESLLEEVVREMPQAVVFCLGEDWRGDVRVLKLMRRVAPNLPLVILGSESSLEIREEVQGLRPVYFGVTPLEPTELDGAVQAAVGRSR